MKVCVIRPALKQTAFAASVGLNLLIAAKVLAQAIAPVESPAPGLITADAISAVERVIVTGSNIPTAEETGPNPVDTFGQQTSKN
jgi:hypothetical protein